MKNLGARTRKLERAMGRDGPCPNCGGAGHPLLEVHGLREEGEVGDAGIGAGGDAAPRSDPNHSIEVDREDEVGSAADGGSAEPRTVQRAGGCLRCGAVSIVKQIILERDGSDNAAAPASPRPAPDARAAPSR